MNRRPSTMAVHDYQHMLIAERKTEWLAVPTGKLSRRELAKAAFWTLTDHLRQHHQQSSFRGKTYDEVAALHDQLHKEKA